MARALARLEATVDPPEPHVKYSLRGTYARPRARPAFPIWFLSSNFPFTCTPRHGRDGIRRWHLSRVCETTQGIKEATLQFKQILPTQTSG